MWKGWAMLCHRYEQLQVTHKWSIKPITKQFWKFTQAKGEKNPETL